MPFKISLIPQYGSGAIAPIAVNKTLFLGRSPELQISDKRCSRKQLEVRVDDNRVAIISHGINPCFLSRQGGTSAPMTKGVVYPLASGDVFTLLMDNYPIMLDIREVPPAGTGPSVKNKELEQCYASSEDETDQEWRAKLKGSSGSTTASVPYELHTGREFGTGNSPPTTTTHTKKRKHDQLSTEAPPAKQRNDTSVIESDDDSGKPVCMYGESCYRRNPEHFQQFAHPWKKKKPASATAPSSAPVSHTAPPPVKKQKKSHAQLDADGDEHAIDKESRADAPTKAAAAPVSTAKHHPTKPSSVGLVEPTAPHTLQATRQGSDTTETRTARSANNAVERAVSSSGPGSMTLALPLLAADKSFAYPIERAAAVACRQMMTFLHQHYARHPHMRLVVVDPDSGGSIAAAVRREWSKIANGELTKALTVVTGGRLARLQGQHAIPCRFVAVETHWRFKANAGGRATRDFYEDAGGIALEEASREKWVTAGSVGEVYPVMLPAGNTAYDEGVRWVLHCRPPSVNPAKPESLHDNLARADQLLEKVYLELLGTFAKIAGLTND